MEQSATNRFGILYCALLVLVVLGLFLAGAPVDNAFSWPDAPRHALNGAFVLDLIRDHPFGDPTGYAYDYYVKYPALTILFYPPLFYFFLAPFYALFGVSQTSAIAAEFVCYALLAIGSYRLARFWLPPLFAFCAALILIAAPEIAYWGRQVMLEIPAFALLVWSAYFFMCHLSERRIVWLYLAAALAVLAMYTKLTAAFILIVYLLTLLQARGAEIFRDKHSYIILALAVIGTIPLAVLTVKFGQANMQSVSGLSDAEVSRRSISGWIWYAKQMPSQIGWPALLAFIAGLGVLFMQRARLAGFLPLLLWLVVGYLLFSAIDLKEARHSVFLLFPLAVLGVFGVTMLLRKWPPVAALSVLAIALATLGMTAFTRPVQYVSGYTQVADFIAKEAPKDSGVVFSGYRDGSFIFTMRTHEERRDLTLIRADKLFLTLAVRRSLGVQQKLMEQDKIVEMLGKMAVRYVVAQPDFWTDLESMKRFQEVLESNHFEKVRTFQMPSNYPAQEKELIVYRNRDRIAARPEAMAIDLPMINQTVSGGGKK
jgi:hypothetical protein